MTPAEAFPPVAPIATPSAAAAGPIGRFCGRCGATLVGEETCATCMRFSAAARAPEGATEEAERLAQAASLPASLLLYFLLLCVSLVVVAYTMATEEDLSPA